VGLIRHYQDLAAWQRGMDACVETYKLTGQLDKSELYGLVSQMRRAAVSIPSNVAEGWGRGSRKDFARFLRTARGSVYELETQVLITHRVGLLKPEDTQAVEQLLDESSRILNGLIHSLNIPEPKED